MNLYPMQLGQSTEVRINLNFTLSAPLTFSVLSSSNLIDWNLVGPAVPRYFFTDTNAPGSPQRYYRLTYP